MRDFFISSLEKLITVIVVLMCLAVVIAAGGALVNPQGGLFPALGVLVFGGLYVILMGGMLFLFLGIHDNTRRTADAVEDLARRG